MDNESLQMPARTGQTRRKGNPLVWVGLAALGLAGWLMLSDDTVPELADSARRQVEGALEQSRNASSSAPGGQNAQPAPGEVLPVQDVSPDQAGQTDQAGQGAGEVGGGQAGNGSAAPASAAAPGNNVVEPPEGYDPATAPQLPILAAPGRNGSDAGDGTDETDGAEGPDDIDRAIAGQSSSSLALSPAERAALTIMSGSVGDNTAPPEASLRQDSVVTWDFVSNMARWLVSNYQPGANGRPGRSGVTIIAAGTRYGAGLTGLRHSASAPARGREEILRHVFTPGMIDALHRLYGDALIEAMDQASLENGVSSRGPLTVQQEADMFGVYADLFRQLSSALRGAAATDNLHALVEGVRSAGDDVVQASTAFAEILVSYEESRESGDRALEERLRRQMVEASRDSERAMENRTRARARLADAIKRNAGGAVAGNDSLVYLGEWLDRRGEHAEIAPAATMAAETSDRLADQMSARAAQLLAR